MLPTMYDNASAVQVKGALISEMLRVLARDVSASAYTTVLNDLAPAFQKAVASQSILAGSWYDVSFANHIMRAGYAKSSNMRDRCYQVGMQCITNLLTGVHRFLIQVASPNLAVKHADIFFKNYYRGGSVQGMMHTETSGIITAKDFTGIGIELWYAIAGGTQVVLLTAGAKNVRSTFTDNIATQNSVSIFLEWSA